MCYNEFNSDFKEVCILSYYIASEKKINTLMSDCTVFMKHWVNNVRMFYSTAILLCINCYSTMQR